MRHQIGQKRVVKHQTGPKANTRKHHTEYTHLQAALRKGCSPTSHRFRRKEIQQAAENGAHSAEETHKVPLVTPVIGNGSKYGRYKGNNNKGCAQSIII